MKSFADRAFVLSQVLLLFASSKASSSGNILIQGARDYYGDSSSIVSLSLFNPRIIGGVVAPENRYPYSVSAQGSRGHYCGGSLIANDVVLTAAHCTDQLSHVVIGSNDLRSAKNGDAKTIQIKRKVSHPRYDPQRDRYDVALLFLEESVNNQNQNNTLEKNAYIPLVKLNSNHAYPSRGMTANTIGWGDTDKESEVFELSNRLRAVDLEVISNDQCEGAKYGGQALYDGLISEDMLCTFTRGQDACQGDSGGPLIIRGNVPEEDVQIGIVSWGAGCAVMPGVFSRVSSSYNWIQKSVCKNSMDPPDSLCSTLAPTKMPTSNPTQSPTGNPSDVPTQQPSNNPTLHFTLNPSLEPSLDSMLVSNPERNPPSDLTQQPTHNPTDTLTGEVKNNPTNQPSKGPTLSPSELSFHPTMHPSHFPSTSLSPSNIQSMPPSISSQPSGSPSISLSPSTVPSVAPTISVAPTSSLPPSIIPSRQPSSQPSSFPTAQPTSHPSYQSSSMPSISPSVSSFPSSQPSPVPSITAEPTLPPTDQPTSAPSMSNIPSTNPSGSPTLSSQPTSQPTDPPSFSMNPSGAPSILPTTSLRPTESPSTSPGPSATPSDSPTTSLSPTISMIPTMVPSALPTIHPSDQHSSQTTSQPSTNPSQYPYFVPSSDPSSSPVSTTSPTISTHPTLISVDTLEELSYRTGSGNPLLLTESSALSIDDHLTSGFSIAKRRGGKVGALLVSMIPVLLIL